MIYQHWLLVIDDHIANLTLNRPDKKNRFDSTTFLELDEITKELASNDDVWVVILRASGKDFSAGVDVQLIRDLIGSEKADFKKNLQSSQEILDRFEALNKPVIAALQGHVIGGGLILALCCDFRIASEHTVVCLPEVKRSIGVIMGTQRITRTIGIANTKELVMLGNSVSAEKGLQMGLFKEVVPDISLEEHVIGLARQLLQLPPLAVRLCKKIIIEGQFEDRAGQDLEIRAQAELLDSEDFKEAIASFYEKRQPIYQGK